MKLTGKRSLYTKLRRISEELYSDSDRIEGDDNLRLKLLEEARRLEEIAVYLKATKETDK